MIITYVYLMHTPSLDICKIGQSAHPHNSRLHTLQYQEQIPDLRVLHTIRCTDGEYDIEYMLHHTFTDNRLEREWFCLGSEEIEQIKQWKTDIDVLLNLFPVWIAWLKANPPKQFSLRNYKICKRYAQITGTHTSDWLPPYHWPASRDWDYLDNWGLPSPPVRPRKEHEKRTLLRDFDAKEIRDLYDGGMTQAAIGKRYGFSQGAIGKLVCRAARGIRRKSTPLFDDDVREIRQLHANGVPQKELAKRYGVTNTTINAIVHRRTWKQVS